LGGGGGGLFLGWGKGGGGGLRETRGEGNRRPALTDGKKKKGPSSVKRETKKMGEYLQNRQSRKKKTR